MWSKSSLLSSWATDPSPPSFLVLFFGVNCSERRRLRRRLVGVLQSEASTVSPPEEKIANVAYCQKCVFWQTPSIYYNLCYVVLSCRLVMRCLSFPIPPLHLARLCSRGKMWEDDSGREGGGGGGGGRTSPRWMWSRVKDGDGVNYPLLYRLSYRLVAPPAACKIVPGVACLLAVASAAGWCLSVWRVRTTVDFYNPFPTLSI